MPVTIEGTLEILPTDHTFTDKELEDNNWSGILTGEDIPYYRNQVNIYFHVVLGIKISDFDIHMLGWILQLKSRAYITDKWFYYRITQN